MDFQALSTDLYTAIRKGCHSSHWLWNLNTHLQNQVSRTLNPRSTCETYCTLIQPLFAVVQHIQVNWAKDTFQVLTLLYPICNPLFWHLVWVVYTAGEPRAGPLQNATDTCYLA